MRGLCPSSSVRAGWWGSLGKVRSPKMMLASVRGVADWSQIVTAAAAVVALAYAGFQIRVTRGIARRELVYNYFEKFSEAEMIKLISDTRNFWQVEPRRQGERWREFNQKDREKRGMLVLLPNLLEEVASLYNGNLLDKDVTAKTLGAAAEAYWVEAQWFVERARAQRDNPRVYAEWERMVQDTPRRRQRLSEREARRLRWRRR